MFGSMGRLAGPATVSLTYQHLGVRYAWACLIGLLLATMLFFAAGYRRIVPLQAESSVVLSSSSSNSKSASGSASDSNMEEDEKKMAQKEGQKSGAEPGKVK